MYNNIYTNIYIDIYIHIYNISKKKKCNACDNAQLLGNRMFELGRKWLQDCGQFLNTDELNTHSNVK